MPYYLVRAIDPSGKKTVRTLEADNEIQLLNFLEFLNLTPLKISKQPEFVGKFIRFLSFKRIKRKHLIDMFENLHLLARSGVPLGVGLWDLAEDMEHPAVKDLLQDVAYRLQSGESIYSAMKRYEKVLGSIAVSLIKIGEETGSLDKVFKDIADHYSRIEDFVSKTKQALIYPAFALVAALGALTFWLVYVLPKIGQLFKNLQMDLPAITVFVMNLSDFVARYFSLIALAFAGMLVAFFIARRYSERFRYMSDKALLKTPVVGTIIASFNYAFFSEYMRLMLTAGVSVFEALQTLEQSVSNRVFRRAVTLIKNTVSEGGSISSGMRASKIFPALMVRMVSVGEETGGLDDQFNFLSEYYYNRLDYITQNIAKIIEPAVIIVVGGLMALIMVSLLLPIYDLISRLGRS